jgi:hypothetical protein
VVAAGNLLLPVYPFAASRLQRISLCDSLFATGMPADLKTMLGKDRRFSGGCGGAPGTGDDSILRRLETPRPRAVSMLRALIPMAGKPVEPLAGNGLTNVSVKFPAIEPIKVGFTQRVGNVARVRRAAPGYSASVGAKTDVHAFRCVG